ncbi:MAG TPA: NAD(P)(+) transhydrogenase (Re/Si-specific) subunit beta [Candidatus Polarisedimenticolaceae bacterium]|nr:NAD(P)(+) transhydrogenase (Re/Si-specific) subunit beta [Candidatus Polarisedimenticolaceae bacterium]
MSPSLPSVAYIVASFLFILSLRGLSQPDTARRGNVLGTIGMLIAMAVTALALWGPGAAPNLPSPSTAGVLAAAVAIGSALGALLASRVAMTQMPELVAVLHSFVGAAAVLVGIVTKLRGGPAAETGGIAHELEIAIGVLVGAVTFSGSVVAFLKLRGTVGGRPLLLPGRNLLNLAMLAGAAVLVGVQLATTSHETAVLCLLGVTAIALALGVHLVAAIGGGDMPVVVSMLNSYSGWAAAAAGFMLSNDLLIITGALVGASGAILSYIMCVAMNRSILNVVFGGFGAQAPVAAAVEAGAAGPVHETSVPEVAELLGSAKSVIVVPGFGMAVAQAQHAVREITDALAARGKTVRYAIHPVAGRLPGHMNVLLAEAGVSYEIVKEMDEVNDELGDTDVVLVIGANDIVNPAAQDDPHSPIYGMPVLEVWKAGRVVMLKRSLAAGYAGIDNPLCYRDNTLMLFGDAKQSVTKLLAALQGAA